jgi:HrpA-like RNA helicase
LSFQEPARDYVLAATEAVLDIHRAEVPGDILVFLTGKNEVHECIDALKQAAGGLAMRHVQNRLKPLPFYAGVLLPELRTPNIDHAYCCTPSFADKCTGWAKAWGY